MKNDLDFQLQIEDFMRRHSLTPTTFGLWAMNDSRFVFDLKHGRSCSLATVNRVCEFMERYEAKEAARLQRRLLEAKQDDSAARKTASSRRTTERPFHGETDP